MDDASRAEGQHAPTSYQILPLQRKHLIQPERHQHLALPRKSFTHSPESPLLKLQKLDTFPVVAGQWSWHS